MFSQKKYKNSLSKQIQIQKVKAICEFQKPALNYLNPV